MVFQESAQGCERGSDILRETLVGRGEAEEGAGGPWNVHAQGEDGAQEIAYAYGASTPAAVPHSGGWRCRSYVLPELLPLL